jgi:hypothetical protein
MSIGWLFISKAGIHRPKAMNHIQLELLLFGQQFRLKGISCHFRRIVDLLADNSSYFNIAGCVLRTKSITPQAISCNGNRNCVAISIAIDGEWNAACRACPFA